MLERPKIRSTEFDARSGILSALLAVALMVTLIPISQPGLVSDHPWRGEFAAGVFLLVSIGLIGWHRLNFAGNRVVVAGLFIFILWSSVSAVWAGSVWSVSHHTTVWTTYLAFFVIIAEWLRSGSGRIIYNSFAVIASLTGALAIIDYITVPDFRILEGVLRARYSAYGELLATLLPLVWCLTIYIRRRSNALLVLGAGALGWCAVMLSLSKGAFIAGIVGFALSFVCTFIFSPRRFLKRSLVLAAVWLAVTVAVQGGFAVFSPVPATVDYISGKADATRETSMARIFIWKVGLEMIKGHLVVGVGADNFGNSFNEARAEYRKTHPEDPPDEVVADFLVQRAHNEPLQVLAETGVIGLTLMALAFIAAGWQMYGAFAKANYRLSPIFWAAFGGMAAFATSSMVSSFSFRIVQNGIVFFIVLAIALNEVRKVRRKDTRKLIPEVTSSRFAASTAVFFLIVLTAISCLKGIAEYQLASAARTVDHNAARALSMSGLQLDPGYSSAHLGISARYYAEGNFGAAAAHLRSAIDRGMGMVITYSALSDCYEKLQKRDLAAATFEEALRIFPRSVFIRVRYAIFLNSTGNEELGEIQMVTARSLDQRQATGWYNLLTVGSVAAFYAAHKDAQIAPPAELKPEKAVLQYLDKSPETINQKQQ